MCKFCENNARVEVKFSKDNQYDRLDSSEMIMLSESFLRICNPEGRSFNNSLPIFQIDVLYCPFCGRKIKNETILTKFNDIEINVDTFKNSF